MQNQTSNAIIIPETLVRAVSKEMKRPKDSHALLALDKATQGGVSHEIKDGLTFVRGNRSDKNSAVAVIMNSLGQQSTPPILVAFTTFGDFAGAMKRGNLKVFQDAAAKIRKNLQGQPLTDESGKISPPAGCKTYLPGLRTMI